MDEFTREELESVGFKLPSLLEQQWTSGEPITLSTLFEYNASLGNAIWLFARLDERKKLEALCRDVVARAEAAVSRAEEDVKGGFLNPVALPTIADFIKTARAAMDGLPKAEDETALRHAAILVCAYARAAMAAGQVAYNVTADFDEMNRQKAGLAAGGRLAPMGR